MSDWLPGAIKGHMVERRSNFRTYTEQDGRRSVSIPAIVRLTYISLLNKHFFWAELTGITVLFFARRVHHCVRLSKKGSQKKQHYSRSLRNIFTWSREKSSTVEGFLEVEFVISGMFCLAHALSSQWKAIAASCPDKNHRRRPRDRWSREFVLQRGEVSSPAAGLEK